jgi:Protein of unknown function (DUF664)
MAAGGGPWLAADQGGVPMTMLSMELDDYLWYVDQVIGAMRSIATELGDELVNERPDLPGANSAFVIVTHCVGVMSHWGGDAIAGRTVQRDRAAEFVAFGTVADLLETVAAGRDQLGRDLTTLESSDPPRGAPDPEDVDLPLGRSQGGVAMHIYEELSQHLGQLELTRDIVVQRASERSSAVG